MKLNGKIFKNQKKRVIFLILLMFLLMFLFFFSLTNRKYSDEKFNNESDYEYKYKIRYDFNSETYIYLMNNNDINILIKREIFEMDYNCNCMVSTGKFKEEKTKLNFSDEVKKEVINVLNGLYKKIGKKNFNARNLNLTSYEERVLLAIVLNLEDILTIESNLEYNVLTSEFLSLNNEYKILNTKVNLNNMTNNEIVNKIANYLNNVVNKDFENFNTISEETIIDENLGINLDIDLVYVGPYNLSFVYTTEGQLGATFIYDIKGYNFNYDGNLIEFDMENLKNEYYNNVIDNFMKTDLYTNYKDQLLSDWESILYDNLFITGNWYYDDEEIVFLIPSYLLGFDGSAEDIIVLNVNNLEIENSVN